MRIVITVAASLLLEAWKLQHGYFFVGYFADRSLAKIACLFSCPLELDRPIWGCGCSNGVVQHTDIINEYYANVFVVAKEFPEDVLSFQPDKLLVVQYL